MIDNSGSGDDRLIDWTGERCVPWADDVQVIYEHYHRYAIAARFVKGKRVLDLACGEGYGAALLAAEGAEVVGVDIDETTVEHARRTYGGRDVSFRTGSITDPDLLADEKPFDVVVCFEAIEHVAEHDAVLALVRNRLVRGGLFLVSTPDTAVYQHEHGNDNPFHVKELTAPEFESLLEGAFRHVALLKQNVAVGSVMTPADPGDPDTAIDGVRLQTLRQGEDRWTVEPGLPHTYLVGIASDRQLPKLPGSAVLLDAGLTLAHGAGGAVVEQRDTAVADVAKLNRLYQRSRVEAEELKATITKLESLRRQEEQRAETAERERAELRVVVDTKLSAAEQAAERDAARIEWLQDSLARLEGRVAEAEQRAAELTATNAELAAQNSALVQRAVGKYRQVVERVAPRGTTRRDVYEIALGRKPGVPQVTETAETSPLPVPCSDRPVVSVIVPVHGKWPYTRQCLRFLAGHLVSVPFEVIVVDDASPDDSAAKLAACEGVRLVRAERNLGFIGACNLGAEHARGEHLFFLNNDAEVTESWLDILVETMESDERIGLVGAKLVYPDGRLQECGGIVWADGNGWNYGRNGDAGAAEFNDVRDVDYCSGAAILVRAELFRGVGGFDTRYAPAYYEDTDLAFAVRARGYRTVVQPKAVVVHHEGVSNGTDISTGVKKHQELNRRAFVEKWADTLAAEHLPEASPRNLWLARHRGTRGHHGPIVLVKDHQVPRPDFDSGSVRIRRIMQQLVELGCRVVFFPGNHARLEPYTTDLQQLGVTVLPAPELQQAFLAEAGSEISMALLSRPQVAWSLVEELRTSAPQCVIAYDTVDVHFLRLERQAALAESQGEAEAGQALRRKAFASRQMELGLTRSCDVTLVVSEAERELLTELVPDADVRVLSNVHEIDWQAADPAGRRDVLFVGSFDHPPNSDAVRWAAQEIMPLVREKCPDAVLHVVGSNPTGEVRELAGRGVEVHGWVPDLAPLYRRSRVTLAPLRFGAGVKGKVGESLGEGVPVVGTTVATEGMHLVDGRDVLVADDARGFADAVVRLLIDDEAWQRLSEAGKVAVAAQFGPAVSLGTLRELLSKVTDEVA
ncbi:GT2 family glycosyltransferase [Saccharopolyspora erythraea NRRL 2338]|uniref:Glycosyl transferase n=2 Tax=Saccharopolyspora erythraea TaxID=1836 RepID=A4F5Y3_SACEN|nr:glycosyltransferase [Saccharopolyspora erythraea]EQD83993.1 glycosyl transferase family 2 [Saccharopolyspora erythraea D]PFG93256.1 GT2 family glycosyltransferase [Saccharopolyspora erythraea NRRL 2338]QRK90108.1 glycosyltransferase [Saccharopolyspora erythraea]CAL99457.1 glycosyl transferase [Saccharopolyspora erythraea NRRL 2338]